MRVNAVLPRKPACCSDSVVDPGPPYTNYAFAVKDSCGSQPPGPLPYVDNIQVKELPADRFPNASSASGPVVDGVR